MPNYLFGFVLATTETWWKCELEIENRKNATCSQVILDSSVDYKLASSLWNDLPYIRVHFLPFWIHCGDLQVAEEVYIARYKK